MKRVGLLGASVLALALAACGSNGDSSDAFVEDSPASGGVAVPGDGTLPGEETAPGAGTTPGDVVTSRNTAPVAQAGPAQSVVAGSTVVLDGSASTDADEDRLSFSWTLLESPADSAATLVGADGPLPHFVADLPGLYTVALVVNDGQLDSAAATVQVVAASANAAPTADAGASRDARVGQPVTLDGSASADANGDALSYAWTLASLPIESRALLDFPTSATPSFVPDVPGVYVATLRVNDGKADSNEAQVSITATPANVPPSADPGAAQSVAEGKTVTLDGSGSSDPDGDRLAYRWRLGAVPEGSNATLSGADTARPSFLPDVPGSYIAWLTVSDGTDESAEVSTTVTVTPQRLMNVSYPLGYQGMRGTLRLLSITDRGDGTSRYRFEIDIENPSLMSSKATATFYFKGADPITGVRQFQAGQSTATLGFEFGKPNSVEPIILQLEGGPVVYPPAPVSPTPVPGTLQWLFPIPGMQLIPAGH